MTGQGLDALGAGMGAPPDGEGPVERTRRERRSDRSGTKRALIALGVMVLLVVVAVTGFVGYVGYTVNDNISQGDFLPENRPPVTAPDGTEVAETGTGTNFLVLGADTRPVTRARADVIVLVHVPEDPTAVQMIHFPRDLYVDIPGRGKDKINAAYAYGKRAPPRPDDGAAARRPHPPRRPHRLRGLQEDDGCRGRRSRVRRGGEHRQPSNGPVVITEGWNDLNGERGPGVRPRAQELAEGDISRGRRQLAFIKALFLKATSPENVTNPVTVASSPTPRPRTSSSTRACPCRPMPTTPLSLRNIRGGDVVFATAPFSGFGTSPGGASIDIVDKAAMADLGEALRTDTMDEYGDVFVTP